MKPSYSYRTSQGTFRIVPKGRGFLLSIHQDNGLSRDLELYHDAGAACVAVAEKTTGFAPWDTTPPAAPADVGKIGAWLTRSFSDDGATLQRESL